MSELENKTQQFGSRWGLIVTSLGMAIGAGNLWRFPRLAGQYGGTFILLWLLFLVVWSIPILMTEFAIGKAAKRGVVAAFTKMAGPKYTWMGVFVAGCTLGITFYYATVVAWGLRFLGLSLQFISPGSLEQAIKEEPTFLNTFWSTISNGDITTMILHAVGVALGVLVLAKGVQQGLEKINKILIPTLLLLMFFIGGYALSLENGIVGLEYMFKIRPELFAEPSVWLEALSQSAWSTGAGWGLILTISSYSRAKEDVALNTIISGVGNNMASIIAGMAILPAVFATAASETEALSFLQSGNQALTFTIIPTLFTKVPGGSYFTILFFFTFFLAAFSSLLTMLEMFFRLVQDMGYDRKKAQVWVGLLTYLLGVPSVYSLDFFSNQDWVWGLGLILSGIFISFIAWKEKLGAFKRKYIDPDSDIQIPTIIYKVLMFAVPFMAVALLWWWMSRGYSADPWFTADGMWNFWDTYSNATIVTQWVLLLALGWGFNKVLANRFGN